MQYNVHVLRDFDRTVCKDVYYKPGQMHEHDCRNNRSSRAKCQESMLFRFSRNCNSEIFFKDSKLGEVDKDTGAQLSPIETSP
jgi:hypothetical protein